MRTQSRGFWFASLTGSMFLASGLLAPVGAQGVRGDLRVVGSYIEFQGVERVSIPEADVPGDGITRVLEDGTVVTCIPGGDCYYYKSGDVLEASPVVEDLRLTAWSRVQGLSARVHLRGRFGSDSLWPSSSREFEALNAYVDYQRAQFRLRAGRQDRRGGLGFHYFDGGAVQWRVSDALRIEGFGGVSRARTVNEAYTGDLLAETDNFPPEGGSMLWGVEGTFRTGRRISGTFLYQREVPDDVDGVQSERFALDAGWYRSGIDLEFSGDYDVALEEFNELLLRGRTPLTRDVYLTYQARYYRPFFELWTIWGAFSPVGYTEGRAAAHVSLRSDLKVWAGGYYREYEDTDAEAGLAPIEGNGWRANAGAEWTSGPWTANATVSLYDGFGSYRTTIDISAGRQFGPTGYFGLFTSGTQQFAEFRFGEGQSRGGGVQARYGKGRVSMDGSVALYDHVYDNRPQFEDYTQIRGRLGMTVQLGSDPGSAPRGRRAGR